MTRIDTKATILMTISLLVLAGGAQANDLGQAVADEIATPVGCVSTGEGTAIDAYLPRAPDQDGPDACAGGQEGCESASHAATLAPDVKALIALHSGFDCDSGTAKCQGSWFEARQWAVEGEFKSGSGTVRFWVQCGADKKDSSVTHKIVCDTVEKVVACEDGPEGDDGAFGCWYDIIDGNPIDVAGKCVDPADPTVIYRAAKWALDDVYDVFQYAEVAE